MSAIQVKQVVKQYKNGVQALNGISLCVEQGEIFSLLGQNGAGKSTLLRILTTYLQPTSGRITMLEKDLCRDAASLRSQIACVAQQTSIDTYLSLEENNFSHHSPHRNTGLYIHSHRRLIQKQNFRIRHHIQGNIQTPFHTAGIRGYWITPIRLQTEINNERFHPFR